MIRVKESDQILDLLVGNHSADKENVRPRVVELIGHETVGTPIEVREARNDPEVARNAPYTTPVRRLDEARQRALTVPEGRKQDYAGAVAAWESFLKLVPKGEDHDRVVALVEAAKSKGQTR